VSTECFDSVPFLVSNDLVCFNLFTVAWIIFLYETSWNLCRNLLLVFLTQLNFT
jgi:hypothetical protein